MHSNSESDNIVHLFFVFFEEWDKASPCLLNLGKWKLNTASQVADLPVPYIQFFCSEVRTCTCFMFNGGFPCGAA